MKPNIPWFLLIFGTTLVFSFVFSSIIANALTLEDISNFLNSVLTGGIPTGNVVDVATAPPVNVICQTCNENICACNVTCSSGLVSLYSVSSCSGTPVREFITQTPPGFVSYGLGSGYYYAKAFCDNGQQSPCYTIFVSPTTSTTTTTTQGCTNHAQCSKACISSCPTGVYGCCSGCSIGQCNLGTGQCYCSHSPTYCSSPAYQVGQACDTTTSTITTTSLPAHDVGVTSLYAPCTTTGICPVPPAYANQPFGILAAISNYGSNPESGNVLLTACSTVSGNCQVLLSQPFTLTATNSTSAYPAQQFSIVTSLPTGNYNLLFAANVADDTNVANNQLNINLNVLQTQTSTTTTPYVGSFTGSLFSCTSFAIAGSSTQGGFQCNLNYRNNLGENSIVEFIVTGSNSNIISTVESVGYQGSGVVVARFFCSALGQGDYFVSWKAFRQSDVGLTNPVGYSSSYERAKISCGGTNTISGIERTNFDINFGNLTDQFPNPVTHAQYSMLQQGTFPYRGNDYNYHEDFQLGNLYFSHDYATSSISGTEKLVAAAGQLKYEYIFDSSLNCTAINAQTTSYNTCSIANPQYKNPVKITILGKQFEIVGIGSNQVEMLAGTFGTITANSPLVLGNLQISSDFAVNQMTARITVRDITGNLPDVTQTINQGDSYDFYGASPVYGFTLKVLDVRGLQDNSVVGVDVVAGPTGQVAKTYSTSCDVTTSGVGDTKFPDETEWCIQVKPGSFANAGAIAAGDAIQVVYKPLATQYFEVGEKLYLPSHYGEIGFEGFNTNSFATLTFKPVNGVTVYSSDDRISTNSTVVASNLNGIEISSDVANELFAPNIGNQYNKVYILFGTKGEFNTSIATLSPPVLLGFWDPVNNRIGVNSVDVLKCGVPGYVSCLYLNNVNWQTFKIYANAGSIDVVKFSDIPSSPNTQTISVNVSLADSGCQTVGGTNCGSIFKSFTIGTATKGNPSYDIFPSGILLNWINTTATWSTTQPPSFRLYKSDAAEPKDVQILQTPAGGGTPYYSDVGTATNDVVANTGAIIMGPSNPSNSFYYGGSNQVAIKVPYSALAAKTYFGSMTNAKPPCPFACCNSDDSVYQPKSCPQVPCSSSGCSQYVCKNHVCAENLPMHTINLKTGWNLFSVPVSSLVDANSNCSPTSPIYALTNGNYYQASSINGGFGYWIKMKSDCFVNVSGRNVIIDDFSSLTPGWNLIGAPSESVAFADNIGTCNVLRGPLWYDPAQNKYVDSSTLDPGKGYFVKVSGDCKLGIGPPPLPQ